MASTSLSQDELELYSRHMALPEFGVAEQLALKNAHILVVGAGGLGAAALPYLAGAGLGKITICDDDVVSKTNLHRQTIYTQDQEAHNKAELAARYIAALNPSVKVKAITTRFAEAQNDNYTLIFDGSDNFLTKSMLNELSVKHQVPLITASVNQIKGQCGIFAGYASDKPCYHCLFPELPKEARNCNEAGVLSTAAGLTGMYQAHLTILYLAGLYDTAPGTFLSFDFKTHRVQNLSVTKNPDCHTCNTEGEVWSHTIQKQDKTMTEMISYDDLKTKDYVIVDVRTEGEIANDPIPEDVIHIEVSQIPARHEELPKDKTLAFVCAGNVRSVQAAEYLSALGYDNVIVLDKFSV